MPRESSDGAGTLQMKRDERVFVAGHRGLVGSGIVRNLERAGFTQLVLRSRANLDLRSQADVEAFFTDTSPDYVFLAAARVGGIHANNTQPAEFLADNLSIQTNVIDAAWRHDVKKLVFLGSSCIYPKLAEQPITEDSLLTGPLEPRRNLPRL
jgi:GDP-L-fucose synthase